MNLPDSMYQELRDSELERRFLALILQHRGDTIASPQGLASVTADFIITLFTGKVRPVSLFTSADLQLLVETLEGLFREGQAFSEVVVRPRLAEAFRNSPIFNHSSPVEAAENLLDTLYFSAGIDLPKAKAAYETLSILAERRQVAEVGYEMVQRASFGEIDSPYEEAISTLTAKLVNASIRQSAQNTVEIVEGLAADYDEAKAKGGIVGIPTGFPTFDAHTGGLLLNEMSVLQAAPQTGKTNQLIQIAAHAVEAGFPTAFFTFEMSGRALVRRLAAHRADLAVNDIRRGILSEEEERRYKEALEWSNDLGFYVVEAAGMSAVEVSAQVSHLIKTYDINLVVADFLQLMGSPPGFRGNEYQAYSQNTLAWQRMVQTLPVHGILACNTGDMRNRNDKRPDEGTVHGTSQPFISADIMWGLYRPELYDKEGEYAIPGHGEQIIIKFREGELITIAMMYENGQWRDRQAEKEALTQPKAEVLF